MSLLGLVGRKGSGKDTVGDYLVARHAVPTRVGVNRRSSTTAPSSPCRPHARGGEPQAELAVQAAMVPSPRAWG